MVMILGAGLYEEGSATNDFVHQFDFYGNLSYVQVEFNEN